MPPVTVTSIAPSLTLLQVILNPLWDDITSEIFNTGGSVMIKSLVIGQFLESVTVKEYVPGPKPVWSSAAASKPVPSVVVQA